MFHALCPQCGAPVQFQSSASTAAVCQACLSTLSRDGDTLTKIGQVSEVLEDYSPLQLGCSGQHKGRSFSLIGRIQMRYDGGHWNEWRIAFDDGATGWLADASGQFTVFENTQIDLGSIDWSALHVGREVSLTVNGKASGYVVSDRRSAQCASAQGELPFPVHERWVGKMADLRRNRELITLDFSDGAPVGYVGKATDLKALNVQMLRTDEEIRESSGRIKGKLQALTCPSCAATVSAVAGATFVGTCGSCGSTLDVQGREAVLIEKGNQAHGRTQGAYLAPGDKGTLDGVLWTVLGVVRQRSHADGTTYRWTDYLLFNASAGFIWLSESSEHAWTISRPLHEWPVDGGALNTWMLGVARFKLEDSYRSTVDGVFGSFNFKVSVGDATACEEFLIEKPTPKLPQGSLLIRETTGDEQTWSLARPLDGKVVATAFGKTPRAVAKPADELGTWIRYGIVAGAAHFGLFLARPSLLGFLIMCGCIYGLVFLAKNEF